MATCISATSGQDAWEEVNYVKAGTDSGLNFGWNYREGLHPYTGTPPHPNAFTDPVFEYSHNGGSASISGGEVYHGKGGLNGAYFFSDFVTGKVFTLRMVDGKAVDATERSDQVRGDQLTNITDYATDSHGHLYAVSLDGRIMLVTPGKGAATRATRCMAARAATRFTAVPAATGCSVILAMTGWMAASAMTGSPAAAAPTPSSSGPAPAATRSWTSMPRAAATMSSICSIWPESPVLPNLMAHHVTEKGGDVIIDSGGDHIVLQGITKADLHRQDFDFG